MKFKLLLLSILLLSSVFIRADQPYRNLIFSEVRMDAAHHSYVEICNMGDVSVDLAQFELGRISPWGDPWVPDSGSYLRFPPRLLNSGETYVVATVYDWRMEMEFINPEKYSPLTKNDMWRLADLKLDQKESPNNDPTDNESIGIAGTLGCWAGTHCFYLRHHFINNDLVKDSVIVDAVNGVFTSAEGNRPDNYGASDVAGVNDATSTCILVRKYNVKTGSGEALDSWERTRGIDLFDSEWLPVPTMIGEWEAEHKEFWTLKNHGNFRLNAQTIKSNSIAIDWDAKKLTIEWGARRQDSIMNEFDYAPGIAWHYFYSASVIDSVFTSVQTGDSLTLYACGNQLDMVKFGIVALPPKANECRVIPKNATNGSTWYTPFEVSEGIAGMDTISQTPFATRVDTLYKYLEKPTKATWQVIWSDGIERPELINGDILRITSENGSKTKEYYIKVRKYRPSHDATLSSITWPDIPEDYKGILGWMGDTIPSFTPSKFNYKIQIPWDVPGVPAFVAKTADTDAKLEVNRAKTLSGSIDDRTIKYTVTAEDDTTIYTYSIELDKEKDQSNFQPNNAEPFFSQFVFRANWTQTFIEICNTGNQPLDLSHYCIVRSYAETPGEAITVASGESDWANRYNRYVPGYVWQDEASWTVQPSMLEQDFSVNSIVEPGDVFVIAWAYPTFYNDASTRDNPWPNFDQIDVNFQNGYNPWGITFTADQYGLYPAVPHGWFNATWMLYKIENDSVLTGLKPLNDPEDVQILDIIGRGNGSEFGQIEGLTYSQNTGLKRLPQYNKGNTSPGGSFGDGTVGTSEWLYTTDAYWDKKGYGWPMNRYMHSDGIGSHEFNTITDYISTITSISYVVSKGYSKNETIIGPKPGITANEFIQKIIKANEGQVLTLKRGNIVLTGSTALVSGDVLIVVSADGKNSTTYSITVANDVLDDDAVLTSTIFTIDLKTTPATISGFEPGTPLRAVYEGVTAPESASMFTIYNADGTYASFKEVNFDTLYVDVIATDKVFFEVVAQNGTTKITYQLQPNSTSADAYVLSNVYDIDQEAALIKLIVDGTNVNAFFNSLIPAPGASIELQNKMGQTRGIGSIYVDDKLIVTAMDGVTQKVYSLKMLSETQQERWAFAYSLIYKVYHNSLSIKVPYGSVISAEEFISNVWVSTGASFVLQNADGTTKTSGDIVAGDKVLVASADGSHFNVYKISFANSVNVYKQGIIKMYPNPTEGEIKISGIKPGNNITIYNSFGSKVMSFKATSDFESASIAQHPSGLYFVIIDNGIQVIGQSKLIRK